jgi:DNA-binding transcriptional MerR regulator
MAISQGLKPTALARKAGVTIRAMRLYEQRGLLKSERDRNGWRVYGPEAVSRLHYILSLKRIGLSLAQIGAILASGDAEIVSALGVQEDALASQRRSIESALDVVRGARTQVEQGQSLSPELMLELTKRAAPEARACWTDVFKPICRKHLTPAQMEALEARGAWRGDESIGKLWETLIADARALVGTDPSSPAAFEIVRRWRAAQSLITAGDAALSQSLGAAWRQATSDPDLAAHAPVDSEVLDFVIAASLVLRAREAEGRAADDGA